MTLALEAIALTKRYRHAVALCDCSFRLPEGRIAALVGPNGAGKTTLLHLAAGLLRPSAGELRVLGQSPYEDPELVLPRIGFLAQDVPLYRRFTVEDMLELGRQLNRRWDHAAATKRLMRLGIPMQRRVGELSGGQRAQVALALALGKRPELLLLDEPLASLDPLARHRFLQELMESASAQRLTVLLSSHVIADLERVCDHLLLINGGRLQVAGDVDHLVGCHRLLVGPRLADGTALPGVEVINADHNARQSTLWVRALDAIPPLPPGWEGRDLSLEEIVVAYMANPNATAFPSPALEEAS